MGYISHASVLWSECTQWLVITTVFLFVFAKNLSTANKTWYIYWWNHKQILFYLFLDKTLNYQMTFNLIFIEPFRSHREISENRRWTFGTHISAVVSFVRLKFANFFLLGDCELNFYNRNRVGRKSKSRLTNDL